MPDLGHFATTKLNMGELDLASLNLNELQDNSTSSAESSANNSLREDAKKKRKKIKHRRSISSSLVFAKLLQNQNRKDSFDDVFIQGESDGRGSFRRSLGGRSLEWKWVLNRDSFGTFVKSSLNRFDEYDRQYEDKFRLRWFVYASWDSVTSGRLQRLAIAPFSFGPSQSARVSQRESTR